MTGCDESISGELLHAMGEFNRGEWFECHETLERLWLGETGALRDLCQGLLQVSVALHHWRRGNFAGAIRVLAGGIGYLKRLPPVCRRIDVAGAIREAELFGEALLAAGSEGMRSVDPSLVPRLRLAPGEDRLHYHTEEKR